MRGMLELCSGEAGDLVLVGSVVTAPPAWVGSLELLSTLGVDGTAAALLTALYVWGRACLSLGMLYRRAQRRGLDLGVDALAETLPPMVDALPTTTRVEGPVPARVRATAVGPV